MKRILATKSRVVKEDSKKMVSKAKIPMGGNASHGVSLLPNELETEKKGNMGGECDYFCKGGRREGETNRERISKRERLGDWGISHVLLFFLDWDSFGFIY